MTAKLSNHSAMANPLTISAAATKISPPMIVCAFIGFHSAAAEIVLQPYQTYAAALALVLLAHL
jgi:hypothetical protein